MNKNDLVMLIMAKKTLDYQKDPNPENWRTIKGAHVHIDGEGKIDGGAGGKFNGKGALPRSMFSGTGKQTEFAEVTEKKKEIAEREQKEKETQKAERKKQQAAARKQQKAEQEAKQRKEREGWYWEDKPESKSEVGEKGMAFLEKMSNSAHSSFGEAAAWMAGDFYDGLQNGRTLEEIYNEKKKAILDNTEPGGDYQKFELGLLDKMVAGIKRADKGEAKEPKLGAPKMAGKEDDVKQVEITHSDGSKWHVSEVPGEKDVIFDWDRMERIEVPGGLSALMKKVKEKGLGVNENYTPPERKLEEYPPSREDRRRIRRDKINRRVAKKGLPPGAR